MIIMMLIWRLWWNSNIRHWYPVYSLEVIMTRCEWIYVFVLVGWNEIWLDKVYEMRKLCFRSFLRSKRNTVRFQSKLLLLLFFKWYLWICRVDYDFVSWGEFIYTYIYVWLNWKLEASERGRKKKRFKVFIGRVSLSWQVHGWQRTELSPKKKRRRKFWEEWKQGFLHSQTYTQTHTDTKISSLRFPIFLCNTFTTPLLCHKGIMGCSYSCACLSVCHTINFFSWFRKFSLYKCCGKYEFLVNMYNDR